MNYHILFVNFLFLFVICKSRNPEPVEFKKEDYLMNAESKDGNFKKHFLKVLVKCTLKVEV